MRVTKFRKLVERPVSIDYLLKIRIGKRKLRPRLYNYERKKMRYLQHEHYCKIDTNWLSEKYQKRRTRYNSRNNFGIILNEKWNLIKLELLDKLEWSICFQSKFHRLTTTNFSRFQWFCFLKYINKSFCSLFLAFSFFWYRLYFTSW